MGIMEWLHSDGMTPEIRNIGGRDNIYIVSGTSPAPGATKYAAVEINGSVAGEAPLYVVAIDFDGDVAVEHAAATALVSPANPTQIKAFGGSDTLEDADFQHGYMAAAAAATEQVFLTAAGRVDMPIPLRCGPADFLAFTNKVVDDALIYSVWLFRAGGVG